MPKRYYLDHSSTSWPKPDEVKHELESSFCRLIANAGRSAYQEAIASARMIFETRNAVSELFGVADSANIVFTPGCTEGLNLVIKGLLKPQQRVAVSPMEHNAVMRPLLRMSKEKGVMLDVLPADSYGQLDLAGCKKIAKRHHFSLLAATHVSNVNGVVQDLAALREIFPETPILIDAAQSAGVLPIDISGTGIDFLCCSAHKGLLGLSGLGLAYLSPLYDFPALIEGGTGSNSDSFEQPCFRPDRYESGTPNIPGITALKAALSGIHTRGLGGKQQSAFSRQLIEGLKRIAGVKVLSPLNSEALLVSFTIEGIRPEEAALELDRKYDILCRAGLHCSPAAHRHLGTFPQGSIRFSPGWGTTEEHIEAALRAVYEIAGK